MNTEGGKEHMSRTESREAFSRAEYRTETARSDGKCLKRQDGEQTRANHKPNKTFRLIPTFYVYYNCNDFNSLFPLEPQSGV